MAFGYPPKKEKTILFKGNAEGFIFLAKKAINNLGWYLMEEPAHFLRAETPYSWMSEKDQVTLTINQDHVIIQSRYAGFGGGWDYGKNNRNIKKLVLEIEKLEASGMFV